MTSGREPWRMVLASLGLFPVIVVFTLTVLGIFGMLRILPALVAMAIIWFAVMYVIRRRLPASPSTPLGNLNGVLEDRLFHVMALALLAGFLGPGIGRAVFLSSVLHGDDFGYHAALPAQWFLDGTLSTSAIYQSYFPLNAELFTLWFMLPYGADGFASLSGLYWALFLVTGIVACCTALGLSLSTALFAAALVFASEQTIFSLHSFTGVDLAVPALVLAAIAFQLGRENSLAEHRRIDCVLSGLMAGFATGSRVSIGVVAAIIALWLLLRRRGRVTIRERVIELAWYVMAALLAGGYWFARNWLITGNPLFPAELGPFEGPFGTGEQSRTKLFFWVLSDPLNGQQWLTILKEHTDWPIGLFLLSLVGYVSAIKSTQHLRRDREATPLLEATVLLLITGLVILVFHPFMPFSGTNDAPRNEILITLRYLLTPFTIGIVLFAVNVDERARNRAFWIAMAVLAVAVSWNEAGRGWGAAPLLAAASAVSALLFVRFVLPRTDGIVLGGTAAPVALTVMLTLLACWLPWKQAFTDHRMFEAAGPHAYLGNVWKQLERLPPGSTVANVGASVGTRYPLYGRRWQFKLLQIDKNGKQLGTLHEEWRNPGFSWWLPKDMTPVDGFIEKLRAGDVDYLVLSRDPGSEWPPQRDDLERAGDVRPIFRDRYAELWSMGR